MKRNLLALSLLAATLGAHAQSKSFDEKARAYIKEYGSWAIEEQQRVGIPASITLAQGIYETGAGESELATQANNHFGIKCKKEWQGATFAHTDDAPNECFRKYSTARDSYKDHSDYLKKSARYAELFALEHADYEAWAKGLRKCGYATNPAYAQKLIKMIEDYDLQLYTFAADGKRDNEIVPVTEPQTALVQNAVMTTTINAEDTEPGAASSDGSVRINDLRAVYCHKGETLLDKAMKYNIRYARLLEINELADEPLKRDMYVYLEPKRSKGAHPTYTVQEGETVEIIAHNEGMNSRQLRIFNLLAQNEQPDAGAVLKLQVQSDERPASHKMIKADAPLPAAQPVKLVNTAAPARQDDFIPTKKAIQKTEELKAAETEVEFGYGAAPMPEVKPLEQATAPPPALIRQAEIRTDVAPKVDNVAARVMNTPAQPVVKQAKNIVNTPVKQVNSSTKLESELAAQSDAGNLPQSLEPEMPMQAPATEGPQDELALLKAKLDKAVYARSSKSNVKVSSDDSSAVFGGKTQVKTATAQKQQATASLEAGDPNAVFHVVQKGETGYSIAKKYGIKVKDLNEMNNLNFEGIKTGQKLRVK